MNAAASSRSAQTVLIAVASSLPLSFSASSAFSSASAAAFSSSFFDAADTHRRHLLRLPPHGAGLFSRRRREQRRTLRPQLAPRGRSHAFCISKRPDGGGGESQPKRNQFFGGLVFARRILCAVIRAGRPAPPSGRALPVPGAERASLRRLGFLCRRTRLVCRPSVTPTPATVAPRTSRRASWVRRDSLNGAPRLGQLHTRTQAAGPLQMDQCGDWPSSMRRAAHTMPPVLKRGSTLSVCFGCGGGGGGGGGENKRKAVVSILLLDCVLARTVRAGWLDEFSPAISFFCTVRSLPSLVLRKVRRRARSNLPHLPLPVLRRAAHLPPHSVQATRAHKFRRKQRASPFHCAFELNQSNTNNLQTSPAFA